MIKYLAILAAAVTIYVVLLTLGWAIISLTVGAF